MEKQRSCDGHNDIKGDHNRSAGESGEIGNHAAVGKTHVNDAHATILHQLGCDHEKLTHPCNGRRFHLTDVGGKVSKPILAWTVNAPQTPTRLETRFAIPGRFVPYGLSKGS